MFSVQSSGNPNQASPQQRNYLKQKGVEAFEEKLEEADFDYLDPARECVIPKEIH